MRFFAFSMGETSLTGIGAILQSSLGGGQFLGRSFVSDNPFKNL